MTDRNSVFPHDTIPMENRWTAPPQENSLPSSVAIRPKILVPVDDIRILTDDNISLHLRIMGIGIPIYEADTLRNFLYILLSVPAVDPVNGQIPFDIEIGIAAFRKPDIRPVIHYSAYAIRIVIDNIDFEIVIFIITDGDVKIILRFKIFQWIAFVFLEIAPVLLVDHGEQYIRALIGQIHRAVGHTVIKGEVTVAGKILDGEIPPLKERLIRVEFIPSVSLMIACRLNNPVFVKKFPPSVDPQIRRIRWPRITLSTEDAVTLILKVLIVWPCGTTSPRANSMKESDIPFAITKFPPADASSTS